MRDYELVVVLSPEVGDEGYPATVERISSFIQERGGEVKNVDQWGRRRLAYPVRRFLEGYYAVTRFAAEPETIRPLEANLDLAEDVLRHLVVKIEEAQLRAQAAAARAVPEAAPLPADVADETTTVADETTTPEPATETAQGPAGEATIEQEAIAEPAAAAAQPES